MAIDPKPKGSKFKQPTPAPSPKRVDAGEGTVDGNKVTQLQVRSQVAGFRRAGRAWPADVVTVSVDEFTAEQVEQLLAEPMLAVVPVAEKAKAE